MIKKIKNIGCYLKKLGIFFLFFLMNIFTAQTLTVEQIDSQQQIEYDRLIKNGDINKAVLQELKLIKNAEVIHYTKGEIRGHINLANAFFILNRNKESLHFLEIAEKKLKNFNDDLLKSRMYYLYGVHYYSLSLHKLAIKYFDTSLKFAYKIPDRQERERRKQFVYDWKRSSFSYLGMMDSVYSNERKCMSAPKPMLYISISDRHLKAMNTDSAEYYINKANELVLAKKIPLEGKINVLRAYGALYCEKKEYEKALKYLFESLELSQKMGSKERCLEACKLIAKVYKKMNNIQKENEYLAKYSLLRDNIALEEERTINIPVEKFLNDEMEKEKEEKGTLYYSIIIIILASLGIVIFILYKYKRKQRHKDLLFSQKEEEADMLKNRLNTTLDEVIELAKKNDPSLLVRFKMVYPDFCDSVLKINPKIINSELIFCAYLKLNFSTKEIATYTHVGSKAVQNRKNRIRKKLNIPSDEDINIWLNKIG